MSGFQTWSFLNNPLRMSKKHNYFPFSTWQNFPNFSGQLIDRVEGAKAADVTKAVRKYAAQKLNPSRFVLEDVILALQYFNVINLGLAISDDINRMITITDKIYLLVFTKRDLEIWSH